LFVWVVEKRHQVLLTVAAVLGLADNDPVRPPAERAACPMNFDRELLSNALPAYDIGEELGQGGMGVVVSGQHRQLDRRVAIKQLPEAFAADPSVRRRFTAEARVLASLDHPHVVPVYDFVEHEGVCLLVMEFLPGGTLRSRVGAGGCSTPYAV